MLTLASLRSTLAAAFASDAGVAETLLALINGGLLPADDVTPLAVPHLTAVVLAFLTCARPQLAAANVYRLTVFQLSGDMRRHDEPGVTSLACYPLEPTGETLGAALSCMISNIRQPQPSPMLALRYDCGSEGERTAFETRVPWGIAGPYFSPIAPAERSVSALRVSITSTLAFLLIQHLAEQIDPHQPAADEIRTDFPFPAAVATVAN